MIEGIIASMVAEFGLKTYMRVSALPLEKRVDWLEQNWDRIEAGYTFGLSRLRQRAVRFLDRKGRLRSSKRGMMRTIAKAMGTKEGKALAEHAASEVALEVKHTIRKPRKTIRVRKNRRRTRRNPNQADAGLYQDVLARLRAIQWIAQSRHWTAQGSNFYGDHLLLERIYTGFDKPVDALGERMVAYFGAESVSPGAINAKVQTLITEAGSRSLTPMESLLSLEVDLQRSIKRAWKANQGSGDQMSLGLDDFLMGLANKRDTAIYLLRQRVGGQKR